MTARTRPQADPATIADELIRDHAEGRRFAPFAAKRGIDTLGRAYDVQDAYVQAQATARGTSRAGYKIGLTSPAMQAMCGIDSPVAGVVLHDRVHASGIRLDRSRPVHVGIEFEIAARLGRDLVPLGRPFVLADIEAAVDAVAPAIEIVDDRGCDYAALDVLSLVADNAWNDGVVLGEFCSRWPDLAGVEGVVRVDDAAVLDRGRGSAVLGHPFAAVLWLANELASRGRGLAAGEFVMTGSLVTTKFPERDATYRFEVSGLGAVELTFAG